MSTSQPPGRTEPSLRSTHECGPRAGTDVNVRDGGDVCHKQLSLRRQEYGPRALGEHGASESDSVVDVGLGPDVGADHDQCFATTLDDC